MPRDITTSASAQLDARRVRPVFLVSCEFANETLYAHTGVGDLSYGGNTYKGVGVLGNISTIEEGSEVQARGIQLVLSGIPLNYDFNGTGDGTSGGQLVPTTQVPFVFSDPFTRSDRLLAGEDWADVPGLYAMAIVGGKATSSGGYGSDAVARCTKSLNPDQYAQVKFDSSQGALGKMMRLIVRMNTGFTSAYYVQFYNNSSNIEMYRVVNGVSHQFNAINVGGTVGKTIKISAIGTTFKAFVNGAEVGSVTDDNVTSGFAGMGAGSSAALLDDFECGGTVNQGTLIGDTMQQVGRGKLAKVYLAFVDDDGTLVDAPIPAFIGIIDEPVVDIGTKTCTIAISVENRLADLNRARGGRYTDQDQRAKYPNDKSLSWVHYLQDMHLVWK